MTTYVGRDIRRVEDARLVAGAGRYVADLDLAGALDLAVLRSPHPKARIRRLDVSRATCAPGVALVYTAADVRHLPAMPTNRALPHMKVPDQPVLPIDLVHIVGSPVAAVVAESRSLAEDAVGLIDVEYEPLPSVADAEKAIEVNAPLVHEALGTNISFRLTRKTGDPDRAFSTARKIASVRVAEARVSAAAIEPRCFLASYEPHQGDLTVWASSQAPHRARSTIADLLRLPESRVRAIVPDVGGAFGSKSPVYREDVLCALASMQLGRPVRWIGDRIEDLQTTQHGRDLVAHLDAAVDGDGRITAVRIRLIANLGAFVNAATPAPALLALLMATGAYQVPSLSAEVLGVLTSTMITGPYRGAGRPDAVLFIERLIDEVAHVCGMDPVDVRRRNFIRADQQPYRTPTGATYDSGDYEATMNLALRVADYDGLRRWQAEARARGELAGIGLSTFVEPSGGQLHESGLLRIEPTGAVSAFTGSSPHGQGHETAFAQVLADWLGVPFESVAVRHGDTASAPPGIGTFGSRSLITGGAALAVAADRIIEKAKRIAAHALEASPEDVQLREGRFMVAGAPAHTVSWAQVAAAAHGRGAGLPAGEEMGLETTVYFRPEDSAWGHGTYIAVVRIDRETGQVALVRLIAVDDCGNVVNPLLVEGQLHGGIAQGLGQALLEAIAFDEAGQPLAGTLMDYLLPGFDTMPPLRMDRTVSPSPLNPLGAKGVGEAGTIGTPAAILNAVVDALRPLGIDAVDLPVAPHRIWELITSHRAGG